MATEAEKLAERREMQEAAMREDRAHAVKLKEAIKHELKLGIDPKYLAMKWSHVKGVTLERILNFKAALDAQAERDTARRGHES